MNKLEIVNIEAECISGLLDKNNSKINIIKNDNKIILKPKIGKI